MGRLAPADQTPEMRQRLSARLDDPMAPSHRPAPALGPDHSPSKPGVAPEPKTGEYGLGLPDELVFAIDGQTARAAQPITLAEAGLKERDHLQEWVLANPRILGAGVLIVTSEFDRWTSKAGSEKDRLDVLGLDKEGRLVVAELKRDAAPDTVELQAIKYAAMASRFDVDVLAEAHAAFKKSRGEAQTSDEAVELLGSHTEYRVGAETLRVPRIVLVAGSFPANLTATTVWLTEMGLDITLVRLQAYRTETGDIITVSQHYPPPDVEEFTVAPTRAARKPKALNSLPDIEWSPDDYKKAAEILVNQTALAALDLCSDRPEEWIPFEEVIAASGRDPANARGDTGGLTFTIRKHFGRGNWPYEAEWAAGGKQQVYYRMTAAQAAMWKSASGDAVAPESHADLPTSSVVNGGGAPSG